MESIENITKKGGLILSSGQSSERALPEGEISIYTGPIVSDKSIVENSVKIRYAFPSLPPEFYAVLLEMVKEEGFTDKRFRDAVHHVIKTCIYPTPTIANFISFDRRFRYYTYDQIVKYNDECPGVWSSYKAVMLPGREKPVWIHEDDIKQYGLTAIQ